MDRSHDCQSVLDLPLASLLLEAAGTLPFFGNHCNYGTLHPRGRLGSGGECRHGLAELLLAIVGPGGTWQCTWVTSPSSFGSHGALRTAKEWSTVQLGSLASLASQQRKWMAPLVSSWVTLYALLSSCFPGLQRVCLCAVSLQLLPHHCVSAVLRFRHFYLIVKYAIGRGEKCVLLWNTQPLPS